MTGESHHAWLTVHSCQSHTGWSPWCSDFQRVRDFNLPKSPPVPNAPPGLISLCFFFFKLVPDLGTSDVWKCLCAKHQKASQSTFVQCSLSHSPGCHLCAGQAWTFFFFFFFAPFGPQVAVTVPVTAISLDCPV
jgi:hypothetical protein